ncbi:condensation domain-containing protein [Streptomyces sp. CA-294286]|uniref:condensation domain-containing protein n=1 Tax=Streptomyces sp. CA-294286 TaxID=3240070 RepID=UPI003D94A236
MREEEGEALMDAGFSAPDRHEPRSAPDRHDPRGVAEVARRLWTSLLLVPAVDDDAHFFALGGHSMLATRLMSRLRKAFDADLPAGLVFEHPVFADFVTHTVAALSGDWRSVPAAPRPSGRVTGPVSPQQERLLRIENALGPSPVHNIVVPLELAAPVDASLLRSALHTLLTRHGALRLAFPPADKGRGHQQVIVPPWTPDDVELVEHPPVGTSARTEDAAVRKAVRRAHLLPFDLTRGNLLRAQVFRRRHAPDLLVLHLHHLAVDGVSQTVLLDDLAEAYTHLTAAGRAPHTAGDALTHIDYALERGAEAGSGAHWRRVVHDLAADLAVQPEPAPRGVRYARLSAELDASELRALTGWAGAEAATDFVAVTAAVAAALAGSSGRRRIGIGTLLDNRAHAAHERTVGPFANSTLLAVPVPDGATPRTVVLAARDQLAEARRWADTPLDALIGPPCAALGLHPDDLVDAVVALDRPYRAPTGSTLGLAPLYDHGGPLVRPALGPRLAVTLLVQDTGALRITVECAEDAGDTRGDEGRTRRPEAVLRAVRDMLRLFAVSPDAALPQPVASSVVPR